MSKERKMWFVETGNEVPNRVGLENTGVRLHNVIVRAPSAATAALLGGKIAEEQWPGEGCVLRVKFDGTLDD